MLPVIIYGSLFFIVFLFWNRSYKRLLKQEDGNEFFRRELRRALLTLGGACLIVIVWTLIIWFHPDKEMQVALWLSILGVMFILYGIVIWSVVFYIRTIIRGRKFNLK